jgi:hypothetical protein
MRCYIFDITLRACVAHADRPISLNRPAAAMAFATRTSFHGSTFTLLHRGIITWVSSKGTKLASRKSKMKSSVKRKDHNQR